MLSSFVNSTLPSKSYKNPQNRFALALLFSGFSALAYQVVWQKTLTQLVGSDYISMTLVVTIFMICLGVGSELANHLVNQSRKNALRLYALIEVLVGIFGFFSIWIIRQANFGFFAANDSIGNDFFRNLFILSFPIIGMGLTTPLIVHVARQNLGNLGQTVGKLYGYNIAGASIGAAVTGLVLIEVFGLAETARIAAMLNVFAAFIAISGLKSDGFSNKIASHAKTNIPFRTNISVVLFGFGTLALQVIYFRILSNYFTLSPIVFPVMLCSYLCLMSSGQWIGGKIADRFSGHLHTVIAGFFLTGSCLFVLSLNLPSSWAASLHALRFSSFNGQLVSSTYPWLIGDPSTIVVFLFSLIMMISVSAWSALFPITIKFVTSNIEDAGRKFARIYSLYTVGNVIGTFICGIFMFEIFGTEKTAAMTILVVGLGVILLSIKEKNYKPVAIASLGMLIASLIPSHYYKSFAISNYSVKEVFEGRTGVATVVPTNRFYTIIDMNRTASSSALKLDPKLSDTYEAWRWNHSELMALDKDFRPQNILVIGLGHTYLIDSMLDYPFVKKIVVVEISPEIVKAVKKYSMTSVRRVFSDPRVEIVIGDGRRYVQSAIKNGMKFDLIQNKINEPWHAGSSNLFTQEFFQQEKELLSPGGYLSTRPITGHINDGIKVFGNAVWAGFYHVYFKNGKFSLPDRAKITDDIKEAWLTDVPGKKPEKKDVPKSRLTLSVLNISNVPDHLKTDDNTDNNLTFEYYLIRQLLGKWVSPRVSLSDTNLIPYLQKVDVVLD